MSSSARIPYYDVVISGMGNAGLLSAWQALQQGKKVLLISDRPDDFVRVQWIDVDYHDRQFMQNMVTQGEELDANDVKFLMQLKSTFSRLAIKDVERFIMNRLKNLKKAGAEIEFVFESQLSAVRLSAGLARVSAKTEDDKKAEPASQQTVRFQYLIGADGSKHHAYDLVRDTTDIVFSKKPGLEHDEQVSAYITVERVDGEALKFPEVRGYFARDGMVCHLLMNEQSYTKSKHQSVKCSFTAELPQSIYEMKDQEERRKAAFEFIQKALNNYFLQANEGAAVKFDLVKKSEKHGLSKDKTKFSIFNSAIYQANKAAIEVDDHFFVLLGDSYRSATYQVQSGFKSALAQSRFLGMVLANEITIEQYNELSLNLAKETDLKIVRFFDVKKKAIEREKEARVDEMKDIVDEAGLKGGKKI